MSESTPLGAVLSDLGYKTPHYVSAFEVASRCDLYLDVQIFSQSFELEEVDAKNVAISTISLSSGGKEQGGSHSKLLSVVREFFVSADHPVRIDSIDDVCFVAVPWTQRYKLKADLNALLRSDAMRTFLWPVMEGDFLRDESALKSMYQQSRSGILRTLASVLAKSERAWQFSHFVVKQCRRESMYYWSIGFDGNLLTLEKMEAAWDAYSSQKAHCLIDISVGVSDVAEEGSSTLFAQTLEFRAKDSSIGPVKAFCEFLREFVSAHYLRPFDDFASTRPGERFDPEGAAACA